MVRLYNPPMVRLYNLPMVCLYKPTELIGQLCLNSFFLTGGILIFDFFFKVRCSVSTQNGSILQYCIIDAKVDKSQYNSSFGNNAKVVYNNVENLLVHLL